MGIVNFKFLYVKSENREKENTVQTTKMMCANYGDGAVAERTVHVWCAVFRNKKNDK